MGKSQIALVAGSGALVLILFFGFDTVTSEHKLIEKSRALSFETDDWSGILSTDKETLNASDLTYIRTLENVAANTKIDSQHVAVLRQLADAWSERGRFASAGFYAEKVAEAEPSEATWATAGSTYAQALSKQEGAQYKDACFTRAERCFENALSINPENRSHRINLALCYVEHPAVNNPMKGIQSLLKLNEEYPEDTSVLYHLARYGIQTGQYEKAIERLKNLLRIDPFQIRAHCLLERAYRASGNVQNALIHQELCTKELDF